MGIIVFLGISANMQYILSKFEGEKKDFFWVFSFLLNYKHLLCSQGSWMQEEVGEKNGKTSQR